MVNIELHQHIFFSALSKQRHQKTTSNDSKLLVDISVKFFSSALTSFACTF